ncbi:hypothetical protein [Pedobacter miscanthi]|jgi:hypothetical protein|uniref:hypothetical protein n=1 Tax=Pedobacter miscanthi TaxID=2259170 RepID=UPI0029318D9B|nr:hypothetical protein [Pedobacter miscanthi]
MKKLTLLFLVIGLFSCKKEEVYGPLKLKNGQEVELLVDHRYGSDKDILLKFPEKELAGAALVGFDQREVGYTYRVKAKFHNDDNPPQDDSAYSFIFSRIVSKEQYKGNESFDVQLIVSYVPGGPVIRLNKTGNDYFFNYDKVQLTYANSTVQSQLEEIYQNALEVRTNGQKAQLPKWKAIKATVTHDPQKFGKAYLVQKIEFTL